MSDSTTMNEAQQYWRDRADRVMHEFAALSMAVGMKEMFPRFKVVGFPEEPDDNNPDEDRQFFLEGEELDHADNGGILGVRPVKYRIRLERIDD